MDQTHLETKNSDSSEEKFNIEFGYRKVRIENDIPAEMHETMQLSDIQFYIPIYNKFFQMTEKNANRITLKHALRATRFIERKSTSVYSVDVVNDAVSVKTSNTTNTTTMNTFIKCTPLFDPLKYLCSTEKERASLNSNEKTTELFLPQYVDFEKSSKQPAHDVNNTAYIDAFFNHLSGLLLHEHMVPNALDCYGVYMAMHNELPLNVIDDLDYLLEHENFSKNQGTLYDIGETNSRSASKMMQGSRVCKKRLIMPPEGDSENKDKSGVLEEGNVVCDEELTMVEDVIVESPKCDSTDTHMISMDDVAEVELDVSDAVGKEDKCGTTKQDGIIEESGIGMGLEMETGAEEYEIESIVSQSSSCSSRTSHTRSNETIPSSSESETDTESSSDEEADRSNKRKGKRKSDRGGGKGRSKDEMDTESESGSSDGSSSYDSRADSKSSNDEPDEYFYLNLYNVPSQVMLLEKCEGTVDSLLQDDDFSDAEIQAMFAQIVLTLGIYQKVYRFTHNDLHSNNIMWVRTERQYLYYCYNKVYYKIPTYGKIYKIIDFGRAIFTYRGELCMGNCYAKGAEASNQYNYGPYYRPEKPVIEPNFSFDLCRFACSIFDCMIDVDDDLSNLKCPIKKLVLRWCLDDVGKSILYKRNDVERYPDFKLYKMISRIVHKHTPEVAIRESMFKKYVVTRSTLNKKTKIVNVDGLPELWR